MIAAVLIAVSVAACAQFALYYWRAIIAGVAAHPVSDRIREAAGISGPVVGAQDFRSILSLYEMAPDLRGPAGNFGILRSYYFAVQMLGRLSPSMANWANAEMAICSRYLAVVVDQHMQRNTAFAAQMRGM